MTPSSSRFTSAADPATATGNAAAQFYARSTGVFALRRILGGADALWPTLAARMAKRLFLTPLPPKWLHRHTAWSVNWQVRQWPFERANITVYRYRSDTDCADMTGQGNSRPHVLLLHGWGGYAGQMQALANSLANDGFVPVVIDAPAHGRSGGSTASLPQFVRTLEYVASRLRAEGVNLHAVIAHSLGGSAAAFAVARGLPVNSMVLISAPDCPRDYTRMFAQVFGLSEKTRAAMQRRIEAQEGILIDQFDAAVSAPRVGAPPLVVHDRADTVNDSASAGRFMQHLPEATLVQTESLGHRKILKSAQVHATIAAFLINSLPT